MLPPLRCNLASNDHLHNLHQATNPFNSISTLLQPPPIPQLKSENVANVPVPALAVLIFIHQLMNRATQISVMPPLSTVTVLPVIVIIIVALVLAMVLPEALALRLATQQLIYPNVLINLDARYRKRATIRSLIRLRSSLVGRVKEGNG